MWVLVRWVCERVTVHAKLDKQVSRRPAGLVRGPRIQAGSREAGGLGWYSRDLWMGVRLWIWEGKGRCVVTREFQLQPVGEDSSACVLRESWQGYSWVLLKAVPRPWQPVQPAMRASCLPGDMSLTYMLSRTTSWTWKPETCSHLCRRGMERHPGLQVHQPGIQRRRRIPSSRGPPKAADL